MSTPVLSTQASKDSDSAYTDEKSHALKVESESFRNVGSGSTLTRNSSITIKNSSLPGSCRTSASVVTEKASTDQTLVIKDSNFTVDVHTSRHDATIVVTRSHPRIASTTGTPPGVLEKIEQEFLESHVTVDLTGILDSEWFVQYKRNIEKKLIAVQNLKKRRLRDEKAAAAKLERILPIDLLAFDWFNDNSLTSELRVYLIDKLLPTLILGMEKVLNEAQKRGLIEEDFDQSETTFNPINVLAQYLMRNNPLYSNLSETSPYVRGLKKVSEELKRDVFSMEANKLARLKMEAEKKRIDIEERERRKKEDSLERARLLKLQFPQWLVDSGKLQLQLIQNALYSYLEISSHLASDAENVVHYSKELDPTDETGKTLTIEQYIEYIEQFVCEMSMPEFVKLLRHLDQCAVAFRRTFEHEVWRGMFVKLFTSLDAEESGCLDRHRTLHLLEKFWDKLDDAKTMLNNPRKWPVIELEELDDLYPDSEDDSGSDESVNVSTEELISSEWASVPISSQPDANDEEVEQSTPSIQDENVSDKVAENEADSKDATPTNESEILSQQEEGVTEEKEIEQKPDDTESVKVSSAAGEDLVTQEVEKETPPATAEEIVTSSQEETKVETEQQAEKLVTPAEDKSDIDQEKNVIPTEQDVAPTEQNVAENLTKVEVENVEPTEATKETDEADKVEENAEVVLGKDETTKEEKTVEVIPDDAASTPEEPRTGEVKEEPAVENDGTKLLAATLSATLITPAPSTDESIDVGPVSIQFSKEVPQTNVRKTKTTSFVTVRTKQPEVEDEEATKVQDSSLAQGTPMSVPGDSDKEQDNQDDGMERDSETIVTTQAAASEAVLVQHTAEDMNVDHYYPLPVEIKTRPGSTSRMSVSFAAEPLILPDRPSAEFFSHYSSRSHSRMTSVFDENQLNEGRFVSLLENFISDDTSHEVVGELINFIHGGYVETEEEKMSRLERARRDVLSAKHRQMVDNLFNIWDNDGQGQVDNEEVDDVLSKYKGGMEASALKRGRQAVRQARKHAPYHDRRRLNRKEFHIYVNSVCEAMVGGEEVFDGLVEYATSTVERSYAERIRGDARRKWLAQIQSSAESGGASMDSVYRALFQTLHKDADAHGNQKKMSAYIALLEQNTLYPARGPILLRYVACTPDNASFMLGKAFFEDMKGISFYAIRRGKLVHVPRVQSHGRVYFWNPNRQEGDREGSLVLVPIRDAKRRTFGLIGIDNVDSAAAADRSIFASHEINFYQGVAKSFSTAFHHVDLRRKLLRIVEAAMSWVHSRAPRVRNIIVYFVEPDPKSQSGSVLRKMMTADNNTGVTITHSRPQRLYRKDNLFRDYLFKSMENSETTTADAYGERHTAYPLRDDTGRCQCVLDISTGKLRNLPRHENKEVQRMLKLLQAANREVMKESESGEKTVVLEAEEKGSDDMRVEIMFDRLMLTDLRDNVSKLDSNVFAELKNYKIPPQMIHNILKAVLMLFYRDPEEHNAFDDWTNCKQMVTNKLRQKILTYDPTAEEESGDTEEETETIVRAVGQLLKGIPHGSVAKKGSKPAQQLYNWAFVCLSLMEHAKKMRQNEGQPAITPVTSASTNTTTDSLDGGQEKY